MPTHEQTPLQRLIAEYIRAKEAVGQTETYVSIARRGGLPESTMHALATRPYTRQAPRPSTLTKLAKGLEMPLERVKEAAGLGAGYGPSDARHDNPDIQLLLATVRDLDPERLEAVQRRARLLHEEMLEERKRRRR